jgi:hypothetical protein
MKCIAYNFNGSSFVGNKDKGEYLKKLRFENGDNILDVEKYFVAYIGNNDYDDDSTDDDDDD